MQWSYKATFWDHKVTKRKGGKKTHTVRWTVEGEPKRKPFHSKAAADGFKAELVAAHRNGEKFDAATGLPQSMLRTNSDLRWYEFALKYSEMRWPRIGGRQRQSIAEGLSDATLALLESGKQRPSDSEIRAALKQWAFGDRLHGDQVPEEHAAAIAWLEEHTVEMAAFEDEEDGPGLIRGLLDHLSLRQDGARASANYAKRRRSTINTAMEYAVEIRVLRSNPFGTVSWTVEHSDDSIDPAVVPNHDQVARLLSAVGQLGKLGERMETFFAIMGYAGMRPEEVIALHRGDFELPAEGDEDAFGEFRLRRAEPHAKARYNDDRTQRRDRRRLKHRSEKSIRIAPMHPLLAKRIRGHIDKHGYGSGGRLFVGPKGAVPSQESYGRVWQKAREKALTPKELERGLAAVPYNLRHACVSGWLAAGVEVAQVAEWAGHSIETLLRVYAKCLDGSARRAERRILDVLPANDSEQETPEGKAGERGTGKSHHNLSDGPE
ncbi:tyrosine-type recombinase/integrase [Glycomyces xiaoerkulensis]|uniref:tyrosine-type recombinase/integrase n=1 Tax=Glycomyces xiaoerkulensis TaxID=2038139 RepID=UPI000C2608E6|nr:tyrosine-type recombinase/integrase [Glycomyces xiaoerkulensis]